MDSPCMAVTPSLALQIETNRNRKIFMSSIISRVGLSCKKIIILKSALHG